MSKVDLNLIGQRFGRWEVLFRESKQYWTCRCDCGTIKKVRVYWLVNGKSQSCGCLIAEIHKKENFERSTDENKRHFYYIWDGMKRRCKNLKDPHSDRYGKLGIKVCARWLKFSNFMEDMWPEYEQRVKNREIISIDRMDVKGNYEPSNCKWSTPTEQARNRSDSSITRDYEAHLYWKRRLGINLSACIRRGVKKPRIIEHYLGCTFAFFKDYIESKFSIAMNWNNYGKGVGKWSIDHIKRCREFDLSKEEDRLKCFHYTNLSPMWWIDNLKKR